jgi:hypothetical protein
MGGCSGGYGVTLQKIESDPISSLFLLSATKHFRSGVSALID